MSFWSTLGEIGKVALAILDQLSGDPVYPTLQAAMHKYINADGYTVMKRETFEAKLEKQGTFGTKTVTLTVQEDGSVYILESGIFGGETIFPKAAGVPTPHEFLRVLLDRGARNQAAQALDEEEKRNAIFRTIFLMFGKIAKTDLHVSEDEVNAIKAIMVEEEFDQDTQKMAIEFLNEAKTTEVPFKEIAAEFAQYVEDIEHRKGILYRLAKLAAADGTFHAAEEQSLNDAATAFGLSSDFVTQALEEMLPDIEKYYAVLGCDPLVSDDELKRHYRELSLQYHPDRISSKDLAPDFHKFAKEKFQEIQNAYEIITEHRK
ncbi:MAG: DnaJ domain-containing protein [Gemmatimonadetes bacterium]|nr:DnaJ domain-containing protein [Gemmatimonadota bacterium]